jgi:hypothetical protein
MIFYQTSHSHCPNGETPGNHACDTTVSTGSGNYSTQIKFPRFHPDSSLITCAINQVSTGCCTYHLGASDRTSFSGPYFAFIGHGTGLRSLSLGRTLKDAVSLLQFYNAGSIIYNYFIQGTGTAITGGSDYLFSVTGRGSLNYSLECRSCSSFVYSISENLSGHHYKFIYVAEGKKKWSQLFRIKQVYSDDFVRFSEIKSVELENSNKLKINIYPSPSNGVVGIKFVNLFSGKFLIQISNTQGQTVFSKKVQIYGASFKFVRTLQRGMYW